MRSSSMRVAALVAVLSILPTAALADDWVAVKLRGTVLQLVDGEWIKLSRGDVVRSPKKIVRVT
jgi:hypothetical protein